MQFLTIALASCLAAAPAPASTLAGTPKNQLPPPSMVLQDGGRTKIGSDVKTITGLFEDHIEASEKAAGFLSETPKHSVNVDDCFMMVSEVTNEQYREFVKAAGARPPFLWASDALETARKEFFDAYGEKVKKAKEEGRPRPKSEKFDEKYWWDQNWKGQEWSMPDEIAIQPVVYVDYQDVKAYAKWAGLRLPTEFEFERAVRGNTDHNFPWGDEWRQGVASTNELRKSKTARKSIELSDVGSFPDGANKQGVMDLVGNVWEWTSSPYIEYPGWKHKKIKIGRGGNKREINAMPKWSADRRVVRSGSQSTGWIFARASTRGGFDRYQRASVLGFRCAGSTKVGFDFATEALRNIPNEIRPKNARGPVTYDPNQVIAMDRWLSAEGTAKVPGYALITGYDYVLFTPAEGMETNGINDIRKGSLTDEVFHLGFLSTNKPIAEPELPAGTYLIAMRGAGKYPKRDGEADPADGEAEGEDAKAPPVEEEDPDASIFRMEEFLEIDTSEDNFIFIDMSGKPVAAMVADKTDYGNPPVAGVTGVNVLDRTKTIEVADSEGKIQNVEISEQWLDINMFVKGKSRKGLKATLSMRFEDGLLDGNWRK